MQGCRYLRRVYTMPIYGCDILSRIHVMCMTRAVTLTLWIYIVTWVYNNDYLIWTSEYVYARLTRAVNLTLCTLSCDTIPIYGYKNVYMLVWPAHKCAVTRKPRMRSFARRSAVLSMKKVTSRDLVMWHIFSTNRNAVFWNIGQSETNTFIQVTKCRSYCALYTTAAILPILFISCLVRHYFTKATHIVSGVTLFYQSDTFHVWCAVILPMLHISCLVRRYFIKATHIVSGAQLFYQCYTFHVWCAVILSKRHISCLVRRYFTKATHFMSGAPLFYQSDTFHVWCAVILPKRHISCLVRRYFTKAR